MPITFSPAPRNTRALFQQERVTYRPMGPDTNVLPHSALIWSEVPQDTHAYTYTLRDRGKTRRLKALAADDLVPPFIQIISGAAPEIIWGFHGDTLTPCVGQTTLRAIKSTPTAEAEHLATIYLLQNNTSFQRPNQLTLSQALQAVLTDLKREGYGITPEERLPEALHVISTYFHIVAVLPDESFEPRTFHGDTRITACTHCLGPLLLPLAASILPPS